MSHDQDYDGVPLLRNLSPEGRARINWYKHVWLYLDRYTGWAKSAGRHPGKGVRIIAWHGGVSETTCRRRLKKMLAAGLLTYDRRYGWATSSTKRCIRWAES